ncbi:Hsp20/alpha crystallin family protein [Erythrobacter sp. NFXS35]|uniref:Hsp20/alpha crystallin family protein n=1 Tax=Erythrobacter sp. NFXS35 TaxID=2818436 RepID=UPI0032DEA120
MTRILQAAWLALAALMLPGCSFAEDKAPDYRYRLTVEVETPEGVKTGSSVIAVQQTLVRSGAVPANQAVERRVRGEAVAVDLPGDKTLFALLRSDNDPDWASMVYVLLAPQENKAFEDALDDVLEITGERTLPRTWPADLWIPERSAYPMLVTFGDPADPTSVAKVDPDDLAASFGDGVRLKRITVELTDDPITSGMRKRLSWLGKSLKGLPREAFPEGLPVGDFSGMFQKGSE